MRVGRLPFLMLAVTLSKEKITSASASPLHLEPKLVRVREKNARAAGVAGNENETLKHACAPPMVRLQAGDFPTAIRHG